MAEFREETVVLDRPSQRVVHQYVLIPVVDYICALRPSGKPCFTAGIIVLYRRTEKNRPLSVIVQQHSRRDVLKTIIINSIANVCAVVVVQAEPVSLIKRRLFQTMLRIRGNIHKRNVANHQSDVVHFMQFRFGIVFYI